MISSNFWDVTQRGLVVSYRRFGTTYPSGTSITTTLLCVTFQKSEDLYPPHFTKSEGLLPCSKRPTVCTYPKPHKSSPLSFDFSNIFLILESHLRLRLPELIYLNFPHQIPALISLIPHTCHAPITFHLPCEICVISVLRRIVVETFALLGCYEA
jgi:hypothetical protein